MKRIKILGLFMYMQGEKYDPSLEGIGYHFLIKEDKSVDIEKMVYKKEK